MKSDGEFIEIGLGRWWQRAAVAAGALALGGVLVPAAVRHGSTLDPDNAALHLQAARASLVAFDFPAAERSYLATLRHNPSDSRAWLEYSFVSESQGNIPEARTAVLQALQVAPASAKAKKAAGDFFARRGDWPAAMNYFRSAILADASLATPVIETCWQWAPDRQAILSNVLPETAGAFESYLHFLLSRQEWDEAARAWQWAKQNGRQPRTELALAYVNALVANQRPYEAHRLWRQLYSSPESDTNLIHNARFEKTIVNGGFDWRYTPVQGIDVAQSSATLALRFSGNPDYWNLSQMVPVQPGSAYRLQASLRTEGITSTSGPRIEVRETYGGRVLAASEPLLGTTGWQAATVEFQTPPTVEVVTVGLRRPAAPAWDEPITGTLWLRDFSMQPVEQSRAAGLQARR